MNEAPIRSYYHIPTWPGVKMSWKCHEPDCSRQMGNDRSYDLVSRDNYWGIGHRVYALGGDNPKLVWPPHPLRWRTLLKLQGWDTPCHIPGEANVLSLSGHHRFGRRQVFGGGTGPNPELRY